MDYREYFDENLIEKVLGYINKAKPLIKPSKKYNQEQWEFFNRNIVNYMFNVALYIFRDHDIVDLAFDITKKHVFDPDVFNDLVENFNFICNQVHFLNTTVETFINSERIQIINFIYCDMYCKKYKRHLLNSTDLCVWLEQSRKYVEGIIAKEIKERIESKGMK